MRQASRTFSAVVIGIAVALGWSAAAYPQQGYPAKPVHIVVPWTPGGAADFLARTLGQKLSEAWGMQVVVENRPGAGTNIGSDFVAKSAPDGYTLLLASSNNAVNMNLYAKLPYDITRDLLPITIVAGGSNILVAHPSVPANGVRGLIALAKARPGQITYATPGNGSPAHVAAEQFKTAAGVDMLNVPYKGQGPAMTGMISGEVQVMFTNIPAALSQIKSGRLKALGFAGAKRSPTLPDLPTIAESGLPGYEAGFWFGLMAPAGTPKEIVSRLNADVLKILKQPDVAARFANQGTEPVGDSPEEFAAILKSDVDRYAKLIASIGLKLE